MSELSQFDRLMCELGPYDQNIEFIDRPDENYWLVAYSDETVVEVETNDDDSKITLTTILGNLADVVNSDDDQQDDTGLDENEFLTMLLSYNFLWQDSGGIRLALDGPERNVVMLLDVFAGELELGNWAGILNQFVEIGKAWHESFFAASPLASGADDSADETLSLRV
ncbi:MAG: type III secretion system chaperone [Pirellulales bacterium]|nr:type III secretion system chaperone [Pirellulales bacterium]